MSPVPAARRRLVSVGLVLALVPLAVLRLAAQPAAAAVPSGGSPLAYVGGSSSMQVVLTDSQKAGPIVPLSGFARAMAVTPDARFLLAVADSPAEVAAFQVGTNDRLSTLTLPVPSNNWSLAIAPDGGTALVTTDFSLIQISIGSDGQLTNLIQLPLHTNGVSDVAITPDGRSAYLVTAGGDLDRFDLPITPESNPVPIHIAPFGAGKIVIAPDGAKAYVTGGTYVCGPPNGAAILYCPPNIIEVDLRTGTIAGRISLAQSGKASPNPTALTMATTPDGTNSLWVIDDANRDVIEVPLPAPTGFVPTKVAHLNLLISYSALAPTPDGRAIEVTTEGRTVKLDAATATPTCDADCPFGLSAIAITPDQRPQASFTAAPNVAGNATTFDASASSVAYGGISRYAWDFGDGSAQVTTGPTPSHVYAKAGTYNVALVETDTAGASEATSPPSTIFTGHTMTRLGGPPARVTHAVVVPGVSTPGSTAPAPSISSTSPGATPIPTPTKRGPPTPNGNPSLMLVPAVGPPGSVVAVSGSGFPANVTVALVWQPGIGTTTALADAQGTFRTQVLVFPRDTLGPRLLQAQGFDASSPFLVVPISVEPAGVSVQLLFRR